MSGRKLKILADENIHGPICEWLRGMKRIDLRTAREVQLLQQDDAALVEYATRERRILLASDKGLAEHNFEVCTHGGIINVASLNTRPSTCKEKLSWVLARARKKLPHNVVHVRQDEFWVVEERQSKQVFRYR